MVLLILAVIWAAVLLPPASRSGARTGPATRSPASAASSASSSAQPPASARRPIRRAPRPSPRAPPQFARPDPATPPRYSSPPPAHVAPRPGGAAVTSSSPCWERSSSRSLPRCSWAARCWGLHLAVHALFVGYVALLVYMQHQAAERDMKVRFLHERRPARAVEPGGSAPLGEQLAIPPGPGRCRRADRPR